MLLSIPVAASLVLDALCDDDETMNAQPPRVKVERPIEKTDILDTMDIDFIICATIIISYFWTKVIRYTQTFSSEITLTCVLMDEFSFHVHREHQISSREYVFLTRAADSNKSSN